jgi:hypothetical protein
MFAPVRIVVKLGRDCRPAYAACGDVPPFGEQRFDFRKDIMLKRSVLRTRIEG